MATTCFNKASPFDRGKKDIHNPGSETPRRSSPTKLIACQLVQGHYSLCQLRIQYISNCAVCRTVHLPVCLLHFLPVMMRQFDLETAILGFTYMSWFSSGVHFPHSSVISSQKLQLKYKPSYFVGPYLLGLVGC